MESQAFNLVEELLSLEGVESFSHFPSLLLLLEVLLLLWVAKKAHGFFISMDLEHQLVKADNKAVTLAFVAHLAGVAIVIEGVLEGPFLGLVPSMIDLALWGGVGIILLNLAGKINDSWILKGIDNNKELLEKSNLAVAAAVAGSHLGSALLIRAIIAGEGQGLALDLGLTVGYFFLAQLGFFLFAWFYNRMTGYDFVEEIAQGNVAAGISFGMSLIALGALLATPLWHSYSILLFVEWFVIGSAVLAFFRYVMDRVIIPSEKLDHEIHHDQNWGVALLEGSFALVAVFFLQALFLP